MSFQLGFIGGGNMSTAIFKGILKNNMHPPSKIWVSGPHIEHLSYWSEQGATTTIDNGVVFDNCDIIFLGVKPDKLEIILKSINATAKIFGKKVLLVSMLAGKSLATLQEAIKRNISNADGISVMRIMPNTPMAVGSGTCLYTPDPNMTDVECQTIEKLLSTSSLCEKVSETLMDPLGMLIGCGPAFIYVVIEALADGAVKQGVPRAVAIKHAAQMVAGSGQMVLQSGKHPGLLKDEVCSPGGTAICGVTALENGRVRASMIDAIEAATRRSRELDKK